MNVYYGFFFCIGCCLHCGCVFGWFFGSLIFGWFFDDIWILSMCLTTSIDMNIVIDQWLFIPILWLAFIRQLSRALPRSFFLFVSPSNVVSLLISYFKSMLYTHWHGFPIEFMAIILTARCSFWILNACFSTRKKNRTYYVSNNMTNTNISICTQSHTNLHLCVISRDR